MLGLISIIIAWYFLPLPPLFDDGPFTGTPTQEIINRAPHQVFRIWGGQVLEVFDSESENVSAIVQLRHSDNSVLWAILADGHNGGDTKSIRFKEVHRGLFRSGTVVGTVNWTYGNERSFWFITGSGPLRDYWYSW